MGRHVFSREAYSSASARLVTPGKSATARGEQQVRETGKLNRLVDPAEFGVVRESRIRLEPREAGGFEVTVGTPVPIEYRLDTTGSMGDNVRRALKALPDICGLASSVLPTRDPFYCASIFGDIEDRFVLCRGQFEAEAEKMVDQLTLMHPEAGGGDEAEDPHYGFFGAAYLTRAYLQRIGLRSYDYTITDAPVHERLLESQLKRVFGPEVFDKVRENGREVNPRDLPTNKELVADMLKYTHGFVLLVGGSASIRGQWQRLFGAERVVALPRIEFVPHVMASITGLTEGTLDLRSATDFLTGNNLKKTEAEGVVDAVAHIPLGAQCALPNFGRMPKKGDVFLEKTDLWPASPDNLPQGDEPKAETKPSDGGWL